MKSKKAARKKKATKKKKTTKKKPAKKKPAKKKPAKKKPAKKKPAKKKPAKKKPAKKEPAGLTITDIQVEPINKMLDNQEEMVAQFVVTFNDLMVVRGFSIVRSAENGQEDFKAYISPPMGLDADGEAFEVIGFLDSEDPDLSPMWNQVMDSIAAAFADSYGLSRSD